MADGRRRSSMTHAGRGHQCGICPAYVYGNGGVVSHGRAHVRRGEAVELAKHYGPGVGDSRFFLPTGDPRIAGLVDKGYEQVAAVSRVANSINSTRNVTRADVLKSSPVP